MYKDFELAEKKAINCIILGLLQYKSFFTNVVDLNKVKGPIHYNSKFNFHFRLPHKNFLSEVNIEFSQMKGVSVIDTPSSKIVVIPHFSLPELHKEFNVSNDSNTQKNKINVIGLVNVKSVYVMERIR